MNVRSSLPGGSYGLDSGTSMAAPHVSGLAALMLQADGALSVDQIETAMEQTTVALTGTIPNNDTGYGRIDAYSAVSSVFDAGVISGTVANATTQVPISQATPVTATPALTGASSHVTSDTSGHFALALAPDYYLATASAFGFSDQSFPVMVYTGTTVIQDFDLSPLPTGTLSGRVLGDGLPIGSDHAPVISVLGTPVTVTAGADGYYSTSLPVGSYTLTVSSLGYRVAVTTSVAVLADSTTVRDFDLTPAPTILLVDSGPWYYESYIGSYADALDDLLYTYDTWSIADPYEDVPGSEDLAAYDVVFWSSPEDSPGYIGAGGAVQDFLLGGGSLFLSGQNVAYYDDYYGFPDTDYFADDLKAAFVKDNANIFALNGTGGGILEGLGFSISGSGGADNQVSPDQVSLTDSYAGRAMVSYAGDGSGGHQVGTCLPYRGVFLSFGFEAITDASVRTEVISRSMAFFSASAATTGAVWSPVTSDKIGPVGSTVTHTLRLRSTAETGSSDTFDLSARGNSWPTFLSASAVSLAPCASATVTISVQIPSTATWAAVDSAAVSAASQTQPGQVVTAGVNTEAPAPVLLVDDDKYYDVEGYYTRALQSKGIPYQLWSKTTAEPTPLTGTLAMYPIVLWVSAYDWWSPLTPQEEARLADYLENGGSLYYNGQEYMYATDGPDEFAQDYLGVFSYTEDLTSTSVSGVITSPVGAWLGKAQVALPYRNFSDSLTPTTTARPIMLNQAGQPNSLTNQGANWRTAFFAFDPDGLPLSIGSHLVQRLVGWLSWLGGSQVEADRLMVRQGETVTYTVTLRNDGWQDMDRAFFTATFATNLNPVPGSIQGGASWDAGHNAFVWSGAIAQDASQSFTYQATVDSPLPDGVVLSHTVLMGYDSHQILFDRVASVYVNYPILSSSVFTGSPLAVGQGDWLTFTLQANNTGFGSADATVENLLPVYLAVSSEDIHVNSGDVALVGRQIDWSIPLAESGSATMTYTGWLTRIPPSFVLRNSATVDDGLDNQLNLQVDTPVTPLQYYLPQTMKN